MGSNAGWLVNLRVAQSSGKNLETCKVTQIQPLMDFGPHPKTVGHIVGYVGSLQQGTLCRHIDTAADHTFARR